MDSLKNYTDSVEPASAVQDESSPPVEGFSNDGKNIANEDANVQPDNASSEYLYSTMCTVTAILPISPSPLNAPCH